MITTPRIIGRMIIESNPREIGSSLDAALTRARLLAGGTIDAHLLVATNDGNESGESAGDRSKITGPSRPIVRPRKPHRRLRLPLGRHPETKCTRRVLRSHH
jgi:hypothetical protein